jgi:hypothetical protein
MEKSPKDNETQGDIKKALIHKGFLGVVVTIFGIEVTIFGMYNSYHIR